MTTSAVGPGGWSPGNPPRKRPAKRRRFGLSRRNAGGFVSVGVIATTVIAMAITLFGAGAISHALSMHDGAIWLWDSGRGEAARVNAAAGQVDMRRSLADAQGHRVQVIQTDDNLLLQDMDSGTITSFDLRTLNVSGAVATARPNDMRVALYGSNVLLTDTSSGVVRQLNANSLDPIGKPLTVSPGLVGGDFDNSGRLWLGSAKDGTAIAVRPGSGGAGPAVEQTVNVGHAGHDWSMSVLDSGAGIVDRTTSSFTDVTDSGSSSTMQLPSVGDASMAPRLRGDVVAVTNSAARQVILIHGSQVSTVPIPGTGNQIGPALVFAGLLYVPDVQANQIRVFDLSGKSQPAIDAPGGKVELENREDHLVINSVGTDKAWVVDTHHNVTELQKAPQDVINGQGSAKPSIPPSISPPNPNAGNGSQNAGGGPSNQDNGNSQQINKPNPNPSKGGPQGPPLPGTPPKGTGPGPGNPSQPSNQASAPGAPTAVKAVAGDGSATLSWSAADPHGSTITKYVVTGGNGTVNVSGDSRSVNLTGLNNGTSYQFSIHAVNAKGNGPDAKSNAITPTTVLPGAPTNVRATANSDGSVSVSWNAPNTNGGTIASYQLTGQTSAAGGQVGINNITSTSVVVPASSLTMGVSYTFTVTATLTNGASGQPSAPSNAVTTMSAPGAPGSVTAKGGNSGEVNVTWAPAVANGSPITGYTVSSSSGKQVSAAADATSATLTGLPVGQQVTITVTAINAAGKTPGKPVTVTVPGATPPPPPPPPPPVTEAGVVTCVNTSANPTYCDPGIRTFSQPNQQSSVVHSYQNGTKLTATCKIQGQNITAWAYNNNKTSTWWLKTGGEYIPYAWLNLDGGDAALNKLPTC